MSGKSKEEIAFDLVSKLKGVGVWGEQNMQDILDMYAECLEATSGLRKLEGRKQPSALRLASGAAGASAAPVQAPVVQQQAPAQRPAAPQQAPLQQASGQQPQVRQQQQMVQQAYQQQQVPQAR